MKGFRVESVLTRIASTVDGGISLGLHTKELNPVEKAAIMDFHNKTGWLLFSPNEIEDTDIPSQRAEIGQKTPSQLLRACLYVWWEQSGKTGDFEDFYRTKMTVVIDQVKSKLD